MSTNVRTGLLAAMVVLCLAGCAGKDRQSKPRPVVERSLSDSLPKMEVADRNPDSAQTIEPASPATKTEPAKKISLSKTAEPIPARTEESDDAGIVLASHGKKKSNRRKPAENRRTAQTSNHRNHAISTTATARPQAVSTPATKAEPLALLIGCTDYADPRIPDLYGPHYDIHELSEILVDKFGFPEDEDSMVLMSGRASRDDRRPTRENIEREFREMATLASAGSEVVICLAGHGTLLPDEGDDDNETASFDKAFCPSDIMLDDNQQVVGNTIRHDELVAWVQQITDRGATVWMIADYGCHTGDETEHRFVRGLADHDLSDASEHKQHDAFGDNVIVTYAGAPDQIVYESFTDVRRRGDFSRALCEVLAQPGTDHMTFQAVIEAVNDRQSIDDTATAGVQVFPAATDAIVLGTRRIRPNWGHSANNEPIVLQWGKMIRNGDPEGALQAITANIMSDQPHEMAGHFWHRLAQHLERDDEIVQLTSSFPEPIRDTIEAYRLYYDGRYEEMLERWPPGDAEKLTRLCHLTQMCSAASNLDDPGVRWLYVKRLLEVAPDSFDVAWELQLIGTYYEKLRPQVLQLCDPNTAYGKSVGGRLVRDSLRAIPRVGSAEQLLLADRFLRAHNNDQTALIYRAYQLTRTDQADAMLANCQQINQQFPASHNWSYRHPCEAFCRANRVDDARDYLERTISTYISDPQRKQEKVSDYLAAALQNTGDYGRALNEVETTLAELPNSYRLWYRKSLIEEAQDRVKESVAAAEKACELKPGESKYQELLVRVLSQQKKDYAAALQKAKTTQEMPGVRARRFYEVMAETHQKLERPLEAVAVLEEGLKHYPANSELQVELGKAWLELDDPEKAEQALRMAVELSPQWTDPQDRLQQLVREEHGKEAERKLLAEWREAYPHRQIGYRSPDSADTEDKLEAARAAAEANPERSWAVDGLLYALAGDDRFADAWEFIEASVQVCGSATEDDYINAVLERANLVNQQLNRQRLTNDAMQRGLALWNQHRQLRGDLGSYHWGVSELFTGLDLKREAAESRLAAARLRPDNHVLHWSLVAHHAGHLGQGTALKEMSKYVERRPFDAERLKAMIHLQVMWRGSPVNVLRYTRRLREFAPGEVSTFHEGMAWGQLGDHVREYWSNYFNKYHGPSSSDRYQGWYETTRLKAQQPRNYVNIDYDTGTATTVRPSGLVTKRRDDPVTGKPLRWDVGAAWINLKYTPERGDLARIEDSGGNWVNLEYDTRNNISLLTSSHDDSLRFEYNDRDKPTLIEVEGIGAIQVEYDDDGEIANVESDGGSNTALRVQRAMNELLSLAKTAERAGQGAPSLPWQDEKLDELREAAGSTETTFDLCTYLVEHIADSASYQQEARGRIFNLLYELAPTAFDDSVDVELDADNAVYFVRTTQLLRDLNLKTRTAGLSDEDWSIWGTTLDTIERLAHSRDDAAGTAARALQSELADDSTHLLSAARWLKRSDLINPGYWQRTPWHTVVPRHLADVIRPRSILVRQNGNVVVATSHGLAVRHRGFWEFRGYESASGSFSANEPPVLSEPQADTYCLLEDADDHLWVGTGGGLLRLTDDVSQPVRRITSQDGLPADRVEQLHMLGDSIAVGTLKGLAIGNPQTGFKALEKITRPVRFLVPIDDPELLPDATGLLVGTDRAVWLVTDQVEVSRLVDREFDALAWHAAEKRLIGLSHDEVVSAVVRTNEELTADDFRPLPGHGDIVLAQQIHTLSSLPAESAEPATAVLTDQGLSIYDNRHVEHLDLPGLLADRRVGVRQLAVAPGGESFYAVTDQGLFAFEKDQAFTDLNGRVYDLQHISGRGVFVARGSTLEWIPEGTSSIADDALQLRGISATVLDAGAEGELYFNDGLTIAVWDKGSERQRSLFSTYDQTNGNFQKGEVRDILAASDGTVWVAAGTSVFRYREDMDDAEEFSFFKDPDAFPSFTHMIHRVHETPDGQIWVVCSRESHLKHNGTPLRGGLLNYNSETGTFEQIKLDTDKEPWFFHALTQVDDKTAIATTHSGFCRLRDGHVSCYAALGDPTYMAVRDEHHMLWNGTEGARVGPADQTDPPFLFGTANGMVGYQAGRWFVPQRLNWLLPAAHLADYGGRAVSAVACDDTGRVYAGTDQGLLVYETGGDIMDCLMLDTQHEFAFAEHERQQLSEQADLLLDAVPEDSETGQKVSEVRALRSEIDQLQHQSVGTKMPSIRRTKVLSAGREQEPDVPTKQPKAFDIAKLLQDKQKRYRSLMLDIEKDHRGLYQMLELKPLDLAALRKQLTDDQVIVQYLPTPKTLHVQIVSASEVTVRSVDVAAEELYEQATAAAHAIQNELTPANRQLTMARLSWLYETLLRPVEADITHAKQVFVVRVGPLTYLPFGALLRDEEPTSQYAIERFNFGYLPTMYLLDLVLRDTPSAVSEALIAADPNGDLPGARAEGRAIHRLLKSDRQPLEGASVTAANLCEGCRDTCMVHLATHGILNPANPAQSYLELAGGERLNVVDLMELPLQQTDLAVLSACQTGIGGRGLEYATLARALAHAGVPSIIATMWQVPDAESKQLMERFYRRLPDSNDVFSSLADAKRLLIKSGHADQPHTWAGYVAFGKPGFERTTDSKNLIRPVSRPVAP
jgi:CHAT domain-containing protein/predicted Zn-dependent protease